MLLQKLTQYSKQSEWVYELRIQISFEQRREFKKKKNQKRRGKHYFESFLIVIQTIRKNLKPLFFS